MPTTLTYQTHDDVADAAIIAHETMAVSLSRLAENFDVLLDIHHRAGEPNSSGKVIFRNENESILGGLAVGYVVGLLLRDAAAEHLASSRAEQQHPQQ